MVACSTGAVPLYFTFGWILLEGLERRLHAD
jgi:hypothetical protein